LPRFGITQIDDVTRWDRIGVPVVMVVRPEGRCLGVTQGKGLDLDAAVASGVMEAIENWHAERVAPAVAAASASDLRRSANVVDIRRLPRRRDSRLDDTTPIPWMKGIDLLSDREPIWVPYALVHTDYSVPPQPGAGCFCASSNGLASGNTRGEALAHALAEVVERDAVAVWHARDAAAKGATRIDPYTVDDPDCLDLLDRFEDADMAVGIWDATSDVGVAALHVEIIERGERLPPFFPQAIAGDGCHPDRAIALIRALTEAAQSRLTTIVASRDDLDEHDYAIDEARIDRDHHRIAGAAAGSRDFRAVPHFDSPAFDDDIEFLLARLRAIGIEQVAAVDLSRRDFPHIAVVRVVVPGLETVVDHPHRAPGPRASRVRPPARIVLIAEPML
jgi:ribosomal protein S12 methylthiotransferase accessory factor